MNFGWFIAEDGENYDSLHISEWHGDSYYLVSFYPHNYLSPCECDCFLIILYFSARPAVKAALCTLQGCVATVCNTDVLLRRDRVGGTVPEY